jgi:hypothetical protein
MIDQPVGAVGLQGTLGALVHFLPTTEARGATATMVNQGFSQPIQATQAWPESQVWPGTQWDNTQTVPATQYSQ